MVSLPQKKLILNVFCLNLLGKSDLRSIFVQISDKSVSHIFPFHFEKLLFPNISLLFLVVSRVVLLAESCEIR